METKTIVIIGSGFGGVYAAKELVKRKDCRATIICENDFFTYVPLLHEVASFHLKREDAIKPLRKILPEADIIMEKAEKIDFKSRKVSCRTREVPYDYLIIATGSRTKFFGTPGSENALELKNMSDAFVLRERLNEAIDTDGNVVVIGGGASGVEVAGEMACLLRSRKSKCRVHIVHSQPRLIPQFSEKSSASCEKRLKNLGVVLHLKSRTTKIGDSFVEIDGNEKIECSLPIWTAGIEANVPRTEPEVSAKNGCMAVDSKLNVSGMKEVFAVGDASFCIGKDGKPVPFLAQTAVAQAKSAASNILAEIDGKGAKEFNFHYKGTIISVGRFYAVAEIGKLRLSGLIPWLIKKVYYRMQLILL
jgi:NADH:ubiquinone reductase (H+-translocating)